MKRYIAVLLLATSLPAYAYLGPGIGGGVIATIIGFMAAILLAFLGILYYPIKRFLKNRKKRQQDIMSTKSTKSTKDGADHK